MNSTLHKCLVFAPPTKEFGLGLACASAAVALRCSPRSNAPGAGLTRRAGADRRLLAPTISAMDGANDVAMVASDAVRDAPSPPSSGYDMGDSACSGVSSEASVPPDGMDVDIVHEPPRSTAARTRSQRADCSENPSREQDDGEGYHSKDGVVSVAHRFSGSACELSTEWLCALCAAARSLSLCPPRGGSAAQAAGLGEPSIDVSAARGCLSNR